MQQSFYYFYLFIPFAVVVYMIAVDENVAKYIILMFNLLRINVARFIFWIKFYPRLRFDTAVLKYKASKALKKKLNEK
jgi:hypothetical protein